MKRGLAKVVAGLLAGLSLLVHGSDVAMKNCQTYPLDAFKQDSAETREQCRRLADQGDLAAQTYVGLMYRQGLGVPKDYDEAMKWFKKAAKQGYAPAQDNIGDMYAGLVERKNMSFRDHDKTMQEAVKWYRLAAEQGYAPAQNSLAGIYFSGYGVPTDRTEAMRLYKLAAEQGLIEGQINLANRYFDRGRSIEEKDEAKATEYYAEAAKWYKKAAEQGGITGQFELAKMYAEGRGVEKDEAEAVKWFKLEAEKGSQIAQFELGKLYAEGQGVKKDEAEAVRLFRLAADANYDEAQYALFKMYAEGRGVKKDDAEAVKFLQLAAGNMNTPAQLELGKRYLEGRGVEKNVDEAMRWFKRVETVEKSGAAAFELAKWHGGSLCIENSNNIAARARWCEAEEMRWYKESAKKGYPEAKAALEALAAKGSLQTK